ncbi:MerR family transcriptional regulator [Paenibacillus sp. JX-17]|uniref:MerR family transcriptional regulator n=1 Tax=Paenibacillus lacisoli TaxID=3064525 RepID=A0ABT9CC88_9BACL|nr:MerR family transcriptional regulator [Paenibacillus sp. JX-17]MDO7906264.1 MerR family transcriptional regulator [Paenibacillus sp. JX-17]
MAQSSLLSIKEAAEQSGLTEDTIRYYEKIGLLPRAARKSNGHRTYTDDNIEVMKLIVCMRKTGMPLEDMKPYLRLTIMDDIKKFPDLLENILAYRQSILEQMASLQLIVDFIDVHLESEGSRQEDCGNNTGLPEIRRKRKKTAFSVK